MGEYCLFTKRFQKIRLESKWNTAFRVWFQRKISGSNVTTKKVLSPIFSGRNVSNRIRVPIGNKTHLDTSCVNGKHNSGMKFSSLEFFLPFAQTVNRPVSPCKW